MRSAAIQMKENLSKYEKANMKLILFIFNCFDLLLLLSQLSGAVDFSNLARFYVNQAKIRSELTILMKLGFWARFKMFFQ